MQNNTSIETEFYDDDEPTGSLKRHLVTALNRESEPQRSKEEIYAERLDSMIREYQGTIKKNEPLIDQLEYQRQFFKKICEKQKHKISGISVESLMEDYQRDLEQLREERLKIQDMVCYIRDDAQEKTRLIQHNIQNLAANQQFLESSLKAIKEENETYEAIHEDKRAQLLANQIRFSENQSLIRGKENLDRQYHEILQKIESFERLNPRKLTQKSRSLSPFRPKTSKHN